jgi:hypothetical protein
MYNNTVQLEFDSRKHVYSVDGNKIPSVTGITGIVDKSGPLMWWAVGECIDFISNNFPELSEMDEVQTKQFWYDAHRAHLRSSRTAANIGTLVHEWIENFLSDPGLPPPLPKNPKMLASVNSFLKWHKDHHMTAYETEFKVLSLAHQYAGTCDFDGMVCTERCLVDWKTGKAVYPEMVLQLAAYLLAREEELEITYDAGYIMVLPKDGGEVIARRYSRQELITAAAGFLGARALYRVIKTKGQSD